MITNQFRAISIFLLSGLISGLLWAKDGRDFAGSYSLANVQESGEEVSLSFNLRFFNYGDTSITDAVVELEDSLMPGAVYGELGVVNLAIKAEAKLSGDFIIPLQEYDAWRQGMMPRISVTYVNDQGDTIRRPVELMSLPILEGGLQP